MARLRKGRKESAISNKSLDEHVVAQSRGVMATEVSKGEVANVPWEVNQVEAQSDIRLEDDYGSGKATILRRFVFKLPPGGEPMSSEDLLAYHMKHIKALLWKDELDLVLEPRIIMNNTGFTIFCTCQPRLGSFIHEKPQTLSEAANS